MLCEKCKNKKPTVFFTDTGGINHSLCASCASTFNNISAVSENAPTDVLFSPESCIIHKSVIPNRTFAFSDKNFVCEACKSTYDQISLSGEFGCPVCAKSILYGSSSRSHRMPRKIRAEKERAQSISELKRRLDESLLHEDYEGAVTLRDQIRKLQAVK